MKAGLVCVGVRRVLLAMLCGAVWNHFIR
jgi:hypothetical protein